MRHTQSVAKNTGLLVSVRNFEEATIAVETNCVSIIDLKEPSNGSLGCASIETAMEAVAAIPEGTLTSIALGEVIDWPVWTESGIESRNDVLSRFDFAKVGLSGLVGQADWLQRWHDCFSGIPNQVQRVAVAYADADRADSPAIEAVMEAAGDMNCSALLIDTFSKQHGGLLDFVSTERLASIVGEARSKSLKVVLAGSLNSAAIEKVRKVEPDFIAVRGAVCSEDRTSIIEASKIQKLSRSGVCRG